MLAHPDSESNYEPEDFTYELIRDKLFSVYCKTDKSYAVLKRTPSRHTCLVCTDYVTSCRHVKAFEVYGGHKDLHPTADREQPLFTSISSSPIP